MQHVAQAGLLLKGLCDLQPGRRIVATGSSAFHLAARTRESLAGRARRTRLLPFSLDEVEATVDPALAPALRDEARAALWNRLVVTGGYPGPWFERDRATALYYLVEAFVLRDASDLHRIARPDAFRKVLELAAADTGNLANLSAWAAVAGVSRDTAARYIELAEQAHLLRLLPPFVGGRRAEVISMPKVFLLDCGLRNALFGGFAPAAARPDRGALWETAVCGELLKRTALLDEIRYWRTKSGAEVDFVVRRRERIVALEVKAGPRPRPRVSRAAQSFIAAYRPACFGVISPAPPHDEAVGGVPVLYRRPWELDDLLARLEP